MVGDRRPFEACHIPQYSSSDPRHTRLAKLARECIRKVVTPASTLEGTLARRRAFVRTLVSEQLAEIDTLVREMLQQQGQTKAEPIRHGVGGSTLSLFQ